MFGILLYASFFGALADPRVIRREPSHENGKGRSKAIGVKDQALVPDMLVEQQGVSPTEVIVFIASPQPDGTTMHLTAGNDPPNSLSFTSDFDEKTHWKITDAGNGEYQIWNMATQGYLHDTGSSAVHGDYPDQRWRLVPISVDGIPGSGRGGQMKIQSIGNHKYLMKSPSGLDVADDDGSTQFKFVLALFDVVWGGVRGVDESTVIEVYIKRKSGGMLTEAGDHSVYTTALFGDDYDPTTVWRIAGTGHGSCNEDIPDTGTVNTTIMGTVNTCPTSVLIMGNLGDYLTWINYLGSGQSGSDSHTLRMGDSADTDDTYGDPAIRWNLEYKQEGEMMIRHNSGLRYIEMDTSVPGIPGPPQMASSNTMPDATIGEYANKLFYVIVKSITWNY